VGWQYKNHLLNQTNFKGSKIFPINDGQSTKNIQKLVTNIVACKPFEMKLPDNLVPHSSTSPAKNKISQYQLLIEGEKSYVYNNQPGRWSQHLAQRIEHQLKSIKTHLKNATDLERPQQNRAASWDQCKKQIDSLKSSLAGNPKDRDPSKLKQLVNVSIKVKTHFFKGENSVHHNLNKYWRKNGDNFESSDKKGMKGVSLNISNLKHNLENLIKQVEKLIKVIQALISPKV